MASKKKSSSEKTPKQVFRLVADKKNATTTAVSSVDQLKGLWDRQWSVYTPLAVQVTGRDGDELTFKIVLDPNGNTGTSEHTIDLDDGTSVWSDLPSTAQLVDLKKDPRNNIGYLLLNQYWLFENVDDVELKKIFGGGSGGTPKVPKSLSL